MNIYSIINKYCDYLLPPEVWENIEEFNKYSLRHDVMKKVQQHKKKFQGVLNFIEDGGNNMFCNLRKIHLLIGQNSYFLCKYRDSFCLIHAIEYLNWCLWQMENTTDFYKKCQATSDIKNLYHSNYSSWCIFKKLIKQKPQVYGLFEACMRWQMYKPLLEDCDCECHYNDSSDSDNTDTDTDIETDE